MIDRIRESARFQRVRSRTDQLGLLCALVPILWCLLAPPSAGVTPETQRALAVFFAATVLWLTEALPYVVASTLVVVLLYVLGAVESFRLAASGFSSTLVFFLLLVLLLGQSVSTVDLDSWFASRLLSTEGRSLDALHSLALNVLLLALVMPSAVARAAAFLPPVQRLAERRSGADRARDPSPFLIIGHVNPIASMGLMTGGGMAIVTARLIQRNVRAVSWTEWALLMLPPVVLLYGLATVAAERLSGTAIDPSRSAARAPDSVFRGAETEPSHEEFTRDQLLVGGALAVAVGLWVLSPFLAIPTLLPPLLAVGLLSLPGVRIITAADVRETSWGILFVVGSMLSILNVMERTGALAHLVRAISAVVPFEMLTGWQSVAALLGLAVLIRAVFSTGSAALLVILPLSLRFASRLGIDRLYLSLSVLLVVGSTTVFPFNTTSVLLSFDRGPLALTDVTLFGIVTMLLSLVVVALAWTVYWPLIAS